MLAGLAGLKSSPQAHRHALLFRRPPAPDAPIRLPLSRLLHYSIETLSHPTPFQPSQAATRRGISPPHSPSARRAPSRLKFASVCPLMDSRARPTHSTVEPPPQLVAALLAPLISLATLRRGSLQGQKRAWPAQGRRHWCSILREGPVPIVGSTAFSPGLRVLNDFPSLADDLLRYRFQRRRRGRGVLEIPQSHPHSHRHPISSATKASSPLIHAVLCLEQTRPYRRTRPSCPSTAPCESPWLDCFSPNPI